MVAGGQAFAGPIGGGTGPTKGHVPGAGCPAKVSISATYGYTYGIPSDQVLSLSGSGCSRSTSPVTVSIASKASGIGSWTFFSATVSPTLNVSTNQYVFSFNDSNVPASIDLYLTQAAAYAAAEAENQGEGFGDTEFQITYTASQASTRASSSMSFDLWEPWARTIP